MAKPKAKALTRQKKITIGRYKAKNPTATYYEIAEVYGCSYDQARTACVDHKAGRLSRSKPRVKPKAIDDICATEDADQLLEKQFHKAVAALEAETRLAVEERVKMLGDLFAMRKILQQLRLESFIKRADAGVIRIIIKRFMPDASDDDVIKIYLEANERWKLENK